MRGRSTTDFHSYTYNHNLYDSLMENIGVRIAQKREAAGLNQSELARRIGVSPQAVQKWEAGVASPRNNKLSALASALSTTSTYLIDGTTPETVRAIEANAEIIGMLSSWDSTTPLHDDEVAIPLYKEVELAAGDGSTAVIEAPGRLLRFAKSTLRESGVQEENAACATVSGNSMERLIMDGATIGIDRGTTNIIDGEIYAFDHGGMLRVKYLYRLPHGGLRIRSENDNEHPDEILSAEQAADIRILGWVFWWSTVRKRRGMHVAK